MKPIETRYKGYRFRSRLEARWAVFFDALGIEWEYEPEGFELDDGTRYLPDFFVRANAASGAAKRHAGAGYWVEIKGFGPTFQESESLARLCEQTGHHGYLFCGLPGEKPLSAFSADAAKRPPTTKEEVEAYNKIISIVLRGRELIIDARDQLFHSGVVHVCADEPFNRDRFVFAAEAARSARFEHGECGAA